MNFNKTNFCKFNKYDLILFFEGLGLGAISLGAISFLLIRKCFLNQKEIELNQKKIEKEIENFLLNDDSVDVKVYLKWKDEHKSYENAKANSYENSELKHLVDKVAQKYDSED